MSAPACIQENEAYIFDYELQEGLIVESRIIYHAPNEYISSHVPNVPTIQALV